MNSELNQPILLLGSFHCLNEAKNNKKCYFIKHLWLEKSLCRTQALIQPLADLKLRHILNAQAGNAGIGSILVCFFLLILIIVPLNLGIQEVLSYRMVLQEYQVATEKVCFDAILSLNANTLSEAEMVLATMSLDTIEEKLLEYMFYQFDLENVKVYLTDHSDRNQIIIEYSFDYITRFIFKDKITKKVEVSLVFDLPLDR